jgi:hypothetical protein
MIREVAVRKAHLGRGARGQDAIEDAREYCRTATRAADDRASFMKVQDAAASVFDQLRFNARSLQYQGNAAVGIDADPVKVVEVTAKHVGLNDGERSCILKHLIQGGDMSKGGLANALTRTAQGAESYDRATELEALGGALIELESHSLAVPSAQPTATVLPSGGGPKRAGPTAAGPVSFHRRGG